MATNGSEGWHDETQSSSRIGTRSSSHQSNINTEDPRNTINHLPQEDPTHECEKSLEESLTRVSSMRSQVQATIHPESDLERGLVGWDGQDDPQNPINFPRQRKWGLLGLVSAITFVSPLASSMFAPAVSFMGKDFGENSELLLSFTVSVYLLGYVFGPLVLAPMSEIYGRRIVLSAANWFFVVWQVGCALAPNIS